LEDIFTSIATYGYLIIFWYSLGGGFLALLAGSVLAFNGQLNFALVLGLVFVANFLGDILLVYFARNSKKETLTYFKKHKRKLAMSHILMKKHGNKIIFIQKFLYGIKTLIPLAIGLTSYDMKKFIFFNFFASLIFVLVVGFASYYSGNVLIPVYEHIKENVYIVPFVLIGLVGIIFAYFSYFTKKKVSKV
jgi:membrane protein DedA with SNARE-associated domain